MRKSIAAIAFLASLFSASAFAQSAPVPSADAVEPVIRPVFDCYHINYAWGFSLSGRFVDANGTVYTYTKPKKAWMAHAIRESGAAYLTDADLAAKLAERTKIDNIDPHLLAQKMTLIDAAAKGKITPMDGGARDAGSSSCHAYVYDSAKMRYRDIDLGSDSGVSDVRVKNDSAAAQELMQWLATLKPTR
jgi:hypothetical protein